MSKKLNFCLSVTSSNDLAEPQTIQDLGEVTAALSGLMGCLHADPESSLNQPLEYWGTWLDREGYKESGLAAWFLGLPETFSSEIDADQLQAFYSAGLAHAITTGEYLEALTDNAPQFVEAAQARIDALLEADEQAKHVAGGQGLDIRPGYYVSGVAAVALIVAWKKGYVKSGYNYTKKKLNEFWSWATSKADEVRTDVADDVMRDRLHPVDAVSQVEAIAPDVERIGFDVERLGNATLPQVKATAARWALRDMESMFPDSTFILNQGWQNTVRDLIKGNPRVDMRTYNELMSKYKGSNFDNTELAKRFDAITYEGRSFRMDLDQLVKYGASNPTWGDVRMFIQSQLQNSYEHAIFNEIDTAVRDDVIQVEWTADQFEQEMKTKAYKDCAYVRKEAVAQFNRDLRLAMEASAKAGEEFVDLEEQVVADFGEDLDAIIER